MLPGTVGPEDGNNGLARADDAIVVATKTAAPNEVLSQRRRTKTRKGCGIADFWVMKSKKSNQTGRLIIKTISTATWNTLCCKWEIGIWRISKSHPHMPQIDFRQFFSPPPEIP